MGKKFCEKSGAWLDGYLFDWMEQGRKAVKAKWDYVVLVDGVEGSGKSNLAITCAYYLDRTFNTDRIVFTPEQFIEAVDNSVPGQAIVWDEFVLGGLSDDALKEIQTTIIKKMVTIRKKRLYIFLVIPYVFMMRAYFAVGRTRMLIHTYSTDGIARGFWKLYNYDRKRQVFFKGKKYYDYAGVPPTKRGEFGDASKWDIVDWDAYEAKKDEATANIIVAGDKRKNKFRDALSKVVIHMLDRHNFTIAEIAKLSGISQRTISNFRSEQFETCIVAPNTSHNTDLSNPKGETSP